ncbi:MAG: (Fe-S)-binding protein [Planctomycetota bacterium]|nr:MAG: (Fe-S)-binding protein [Planctomycetota bacterium]
MKVSLFVTCLVDQLWPSAGVAAVEVLRRAGCQVEFDPEQTCCGQPAFNSGYREEARKVARHFLNVMTKSSAEAIVSPSGSCVAMVHHLPKLFEGTPDHGAAVEVAERTFELGSFLVKRLGIEDLGAQYAGRLSWHDSCHGLRELGIYEEPRRLLRRVQGVELIELPTHDSCCGFGGTFSVKHSDISVAMLDYKLQALQDQNVDALVGADVSCLMQIRSRLQRRGSKVQTFHLAEILASRG